MATTACLTCIKSIGSDEPWLTISKNEDAQKALSKHFWFAEDQYLKSLICLPCWQKIDEFNRFYCEVEQLHAEKTFPPIHLLEIKQEANPLPSTPELEEVDRLDTDDTRAKSEEKEASDLRSGEGDKVVKDTPKVSEHNKDNKVVEEEEDDEDDDNDDDDDDDYNPEKGSSEHEPSDEDDNDSGSKAKRRRMDKGDIEKIHQYAKANIKLECTACAETSETFEDLQKHAMMAHETQAHVFCCERKYTNLYRLNDHIMTHLNPDSFKCQQCSKQCPNREALRKHIVHIHISEEEKKYQCKVCSQKFLKQRSLVMHEQNHVRKGIKEDEEARKRQADRKKHEMDKDKMISENINLECDSCQKKFDNFLALQKHSRSDHQKMAYVFCCDSKFNNKSRLLDHVRFHLDPTTFQCKICFKNMLHTEALRRHMDSNHTPEEAKTLKCSVCPKMFSHQKFLTTHERNHNRTLPCEYCDKWYTVESQLREHIRSIHTKESIFVCHICAKSFHVYSTYRSHMQAHGAIPKKVKPKEPKECPVCGVVTVKLNKHMRVHSGTKTCEICGQVCKNVVTYKAHMRNHKIGDFMCSVCEKGFKKEITLKEHMASHTGERLYSCDFCDRTFNSNANRSNHRKKMHPQQWLEDKLKKEEARRQAQQAREAQAE